MATYRKHPYLVLPFIPNPFIRITVVDGYLRTESFGLFGFREDSSISLAKIDNCSPPKGVLKKNFGYGEVVVTVNGKDHFFPNITSVREFISAVEDREGNNSLKDSSIGRCRSAIEKDREASPSLAHGSLEATQDEVGRNSRAVPIYELSEAEVCIPQIPSELWSFLTATKGYPSNNELVSGNSPISVLKGQFVKRGEVIVQLSNNVDGFSYHMTRKFPAPSEWVSRILYFFRIGPNTTNIVAPFDCKVSSCDLVRLRNTWDEVTNAPRFGPILTLIPAVGESTDRAVETAFEPFLAWIENWIDPPEGIPDEIVSSDGHVTASQKKEYADNLLKWIRIVRNYDGIKI